MDKQSYAAEIEHLHLNLLILRGLIYALETVMESTRLQPIGKAEAIDGTLLALSRYAEQCVEDSSFINDHTDSGEMK